jgi:hypothetical protein
MPWGVELDAGRGIIVVTYEGHVTLQDVRACAAAVIALMKEADTAFVLTDFSGVSRLDSSTTDVVGLPELYHRLGLDRPFREALAAPDGSAARDQAMFYETVCVNRGYQVRAFATRARALDWLGAPG